MKNAAKNLARFLYSVIFITLLLKFIYHISGLFAFKYDALEWLEAPVFLAIGILGINYKYYGIIYLLLIVALLILDRIYFKIISKFRYLILIASLYIVVSEWILYKYSSAYICKGFLIVTIMPFIALFSIFGRKVFSLYWKSFTALNNKQEFNAEFFKFADTGCRYTRGATVFALFYWLFSIFNAYINQSAALALPVLQGLAYVGLGIILSEFYFGHLRNIYSKD
jgi:hypothetical protein